MIVDLGNLGIEPKSSEEVARVGTIPSLSLSASIGLSEVSALLVPWQP
jgi:hypothetical protein